MVREHTVNGWMAVGHKEAGPADTVRILGRRPTRVVDDYSPEGGFGWMYGWRWQESWTPEASYTLPEDLFNHLPPCPVLEVVRQRTLGRGVVPRWPTEAEALAALDAAAKSWAEARS